MMDARSKMNEAQTRHHLIDRALQKQHWRSQWIEHEMSVQQLIGEGAGVSSRKRIDYVLYYQPHRDMKAIPIAVLEAKKVDAELEEGLLLRSLKTRCSTGRL